MAVQHMRIDTGAPLRLSWGALFGGAAVAGGSWILLHALCFAAGLSGKLPASPAELKAAAIGSGVYSVIVSVVSLFVGGLVAARSSGASTRGNGALHGLVLWGLSTVGGLVLMTMAASSALGTVVGVGMEMGPAAGPEVERWRAPHGLVGVDPTELMNSVNESLVREGKRPATEERIDAALEDAIGRAFREGRSTTDTLVDALVENTGLAKKKAEQIVRELERRLGEPAARMPRHMGPPRPGMGPGAAPAPYGGPSARMMSAMLWAVFASMLLSLCAAVAGAMLGVPRRPLAVAMPVEHPPAPPSGVEKVTPPEP